MFILKSKFLKFPSITETTDRSTYRREMMNITEHKIRTGATYLRNEEHTYANMNRSELKQRKTEMYPGKNKLKLIILVLAVLLILMFIIVVILTRLLVIHKTGTTENFSQYNDSSCDSGWLHFQDSCYLFTSSRSNWTTARTTCKQMQSDLAIITSEREQGKRIMVESPADCAYFWNNEEIWGICIKPQPRIKWRELFMSYQMSDRHYWIGLSDVETENVFKWVDGTILSSTSFSNWRAGNPDNKNEEDCVQLRDCGKWNDASCSGENYAVCEKIIKN